ncbi:hypothetical protein FRC08_006632 [Ceratobasidium sp. 394]|nr:hypothetical protein FRC08_006632 [Ceratobasidium sp. 394]
MSNNQTSSKAPSLPYFVATFEGCAVTIKRDADYKTTMKYLKKSISKLRTANYQHISISTTLPEYSDTLVRISEETWPDLVDYVKTAEITLDHADLVLPSEEVTTVTTLNPVAQGTSHPRDISAQVKRLQGAVRPPGNIIYSPNFGFSVTLCTNFQKRLETSNVTPGLRLQYLMNLIEDKYGLPVALQRLELLGNLLDAPKHSISVE